MAIRGIDTQIMAAKPADMSASQARVQKQDELHMQQTANTLNRDAELQKERTVAAARAEDKRVGVDERERGGGGRSEKREEDEKGEKGQPYQDPMLSLPVEKGKYAKREQHFIDLKL